MRLRDANDGTKAGAVSVRKAAIENHESAIAAPLQPPPRLGQRSRAGDLVAVSLQARAQERQNVRIIFDKQNRISHRHSALHAAGKTRLTQKVLRWNASDYVGPRRTAAIAVATCAMGNSK